MDIPIQKSVPSSKLNDKTILIYGPTQFGKSTWCSNADNALFLSTEPGLRSLSVFKIDITNWDEFLQACNILTSGDNKFKTIIIDTIDNAYKFCHDWICKKNGVVHPGDKQWGKIYRLIYDEFERVIHKLAFLDYGLILVSHSKTKDIKTKTFERTVVCPTLPDAPLKTICGFIDFILYCDLDFMTTKDNKKEMVRVVRTKPTDEYMAGCRIDSIPDVLPLDYKIFKQELEKALRKEVK